MRQIELDLGAVPAPEPPLPLPPEVKERLVRVMAEAILAVHHTPGEVRDAERRLEL